MCVPIVKAKQRGLARAPVHRRSYVVTGGAGFIGKHLCLSLLRQGHAVYCLDDFSTSDHASLCILRTFPDFNYRSWDVRRQLEDIAPSCDAVVHLACAASPPQYQADRVKTAMTCAVGTFNALMLAKRHRATFLLASTSEIYGDPEVHPQVEGYRGNVNPVGPRSCYDEGKRFAESLTTDFCTQNGVTGRIARIFNTYGPGMQLDDGRVVSNFITQAVSGQDITIYGEGQQTRSFCFVEDTVRGLMSLAHAPEVSGPVNIGNPNELTVADLARTVLKLTGSRARTVQVPLPVDDPRRRRPDISRAMAELKWHPRVSLTTGLKRTIADFRDRLGAERLAVAASRPSSARPHEGAAYGVSA